MASDTIIVEGGIGAKLDRLPDKPGVYLMKGKGGEILYIGKANILADRVRSYFLKGADLTPKTRLLLSLVTDIETLVTRSELEALILENNLIKRHRPRFNVVLRDDKNYPYLRLPIKEAFPRFSIVRKVQNDGALTTAPTCQPARCGRPCARSRRSFPWPPAPSRSMARPSGPASNTRSSAAWRPVSATRRPRSTTRSSSRRGCSSKGGTRSFWKVTARKWMGRPSGRTLRRPPVSGIASSRSSAPSSASAWRRPRTWTRTSSAWFGRARRRTS